MIVPARVLRSSAVTSGANSPRARTRELNPRPCGFYGHPRRPCDCHPAALQRYRARVSGPLLDRIALHVAVEPVDAQALRASRPGEPSARVRQRVERARAHQMRRFAGRQAQCNGQMSAADVRAFCGLDVKSSRLLHRAIEAMALSARAHDRILKVARTLADLDGSAAIGSAHVSVALQFRQLDREALR